MVKIVYKQTFASVTLHSAAQAYVDRSNLGILLVSYQNSWVNFEKGVGKGGIHGTLFGAFNSTKAIYFKRRGRDLPKYPDGAFPTTHFSIKYSLQDIRLRIVLLLLAQSLLLLKTQMRLIESLNKTR